MTTTISEPESERLESKSATHGKLPENAWVTVSAFSNTRRHWTISEILSKNGLVFVLSDKKSILSDKLMLILPLLVTILSDTLSDKV